VIDLDMAEEVFEASVDGTVGLEEEFAILDPQSLDLAPRFEELRDSASPELAEHITGELIRSEIEIVSGRGTDFRDAVARQREARRLLFGHMADRGVMLGSTGTHPWADYREQPNIDTEHYRRVVEGLGYVARRNNTFSLHVHVGVQGLDRAVRVCDRLRPVLPDLLAVSANSPFVDGLDTSLHSARTEIFTRVFPRCGIPDAYGSWAAYRDYLELLIETNSIVEYTQVWWSVRPHVAFGTVEMRICDAQATAEESEALAELIVACVQQAASDVDEGVAFEHPPARLLEENLWRAVRHGLDGSMLDLAARAEVPSAGIVDRLLEWTAPVRDSEPSFPDRNGAQRQRALHAGGASLRDVYASIVEETQTSYGRAAQPAR
jgi:glutamate---cysteine ligase / carboxylate-amine ligase